MDNTKPGLSVRVNGLNCIRKAAESIDAGDQDLLETAIFQLSQYVEPELCPTHGVKAQNVIIHACGAGLALVENLRLKGSVTATRCSNLDFAMITLQGPLGVTIRAIAVLSVAEGIAEAVAYLCVKSRFHGDFNQFCLQCA